MWVTPPTYQAPTEPLEVWSRPCHLSLALFSTPKSVLYQKRRVQLNRFNSVSPLGFGLKIPDDSRLLFSSKSFQSQVNVQFRDLGIRGAGESFSGRVEGIRECTCRWDFLPSSSKTQGTKSRSKNGNCLAAAGSAPPWLDFHLICI